MEDIFLSASDESEHVSPTVCIAVAEPQTSP